MVKADAASAEFPTAKVKTIPCSSDSVVAFGNKISVAWSEEPLPDGNYHLVVETDTLSDLAGNRNTSRSALALTVPFEASRYKEQVNFGC